VTESQLRPEAVSPDLHCRVPAPFVRPSTLGPKGCPSSTEWTRHPERNTVCIR
jgi:hypothetical protein